MLVLGLTLTIRDNYNSIYLSGWSSHSLARLVLNTFILELFTVSSFNWFQSFIILIAKTCCLVLPLTQGFFNFRL